MITSRTSTRLCRDATAAYLDTARINFTTLQEVDEHYLNLLTYKEEIQRGKGASEGEYNMVRER